MGQRLLNTPDLSLGPEWAALEMLAMGLKCPLEQTRFVDLFTSEDFDFGELLEQAVRHKMMPMLAFHAFKEKVTNHIPDAVVRHLRTSLEVNRHHITLFRREAARVITAFNANGVQFACTKAITFESSIYGGNGTRPMADLDFLVYFDDRALVLDCLK